MMWITSVKREVQELGVTPSARAKLEPVSLRQRKLWSRDPSFRGIIGVELIFSYQGRIEIGFSEGGERSGHDGRAPSFHQLE